MNREEFQTERTRIISEMLDNPDEYGIYPTTKCFKQLDALFDSLSLPPAEGAEEILPPAENDYAYAWHVNGTEQSGVITMENPPKIICYCSEDNARMIIDALNATLHAQRIAEKMVEKKLKNAPKNCPKAAQCAHVDGGMKCPPNVICPI